MTKQQLRARCKKLGIIGPPELAEVLGIHRTHAWKLWEGVRTVTARTERDLELIERTLPYALSNPMRRILEQAKADGDPLPEPEPRSNFERGQDWQPIYERMRDAGLVRFLRGKPHATAKGIQAIEWYRFHGSEK